MPKPYNNQPEYNTDVNSILDTIIAESHPVYEQLPQESLVQRYKNSLIARNPVAILATVVPILLLVTSVAAISLSPKNSGTSPTSLVATGPGEESDLSESEDAVSTEDANIPDSVSTDFVDTDITNPGNVANLPGEDTDNPSVPSPSPSPSPAGVVIPVPPKAPSPAKPTVSTLGLVTWNVFKDNSASNVANGAAAQTNDDNNIIVLQEVHSVSFRSAIKGRIISCSGCKYTGYVHNYSSNGSTPGSLPIYWNKHLYTDVKNGYTKVSGPLGSGSNYISSKWITWVKLRDKKTGRQFYVLNTHYVAHVESHGKPNGTKLRLDNYSDHMKKMDSLLDGFQKENIPIFVAGDFNVNYRYDKDVRNHLFPYYRMGKQNFKSSFQLLGAPSGGTHVGSGKGERLIDYVFVMNHSKAKATKSHKGSNRNGSDHYPVWARLTLTK